MRRGGFELVEGVAGLDESGAASPRVVPGRGCLDAEAELLVVQVGDQLADLRGIDLTPCVASSFLDQRQSLGRCRQELAIELEVFASIRQVVPDPLLVFVLHRRRFDRAEYLAGQVPKERRGVGAARRQRTPSGEKARLITVS